MTTGLCWAWIPEAAISRNAARKLKPAFPFFLFDWPDFTFAT
jgi:hypothetical protein